MQRVLRGAHVESTDFYRVREPVTDAPLAAITEWLRTWPAGIGEAELDARRRAWHGPPSVE